MAVRKILRKTTDRALDHLKAPETEGTLGKEAWEAVTGLAKESFDQSAAVQLYQYFVPEETRQNIQQGALTGLVKTVETGTAVWEDLKTIDEYEKYSPAAYITSATAHTAEFALKRYDQAFDYLSKKTGIYRPWLDVVEMFIPYGAVMKASKLKHAGKLSNVTKSIGNVADLNKLQNISAITKVDTPVTSIVRQTAEQTLKETAEQVGKQTLKQTVKSADSSVTKALKNLDIDAPHNLIDETFKAIDDLTDPPWNYDIRRQWETVKQNLIEKGFPNEANIINRYIIHMNFGETVPGKRILSELRENLPNAIPTGTLATAAKSDKISRAGQQIIETTALDITDAQKIAHKLGQTPEQFLKDQGLLHQLSPDDMFTGNTAEQIRKRQKHVSQLYEELGALDASQFIGDQKTYIRKSGEEIAVLAKPRTEAKKIQSLIGQAEKILGNQRPKWYNPKTYSTWVFESKGKGKWSAIDYLKKKLRVNKRLNLSKGKYISLEEFVEELGPELGAKAFHLNENKLEKLYRWVSKEGANLDHILPISGKKGGYLVHTNMLLQLVEINIKKGNKILPTQLLKDMGVPLTKAEAIRSVLKPQKMTNKQKRIEIIKALGIVK